MQVSSVEPVRHVPWSGPKLELVTACGSLKGGRSDWLIEKATELGAFSVIPLLTANSPQLGGSAAAQKTKSRPKGGSQTSGRLGRWRRVATAGMKQSLRTHELHITEPWCTQDLVNCVDQGAHALIGAEGGSDVLEALQTILPLHRVRSCCCSWLSCLSIASGGFLSYTLVNSSMSMQLHAAWSPTLIAEELVQRLQRSPNHRSSSF